MNREVVPPDTGTVFRAMRALRTDLEDEGRFVRTVDEVQRPQGYRLLGAFEEDALLQLVRHQLALQSVPSPVPPEAPATCVSPANGRFSSDFSGSTASPLSSWSIAVRASPGSSGPK